MGMVMGVADEVAVLNNGELIAEGTPDAVRKRSASHRSIPEKEKRQMLRIRKLTVRYGPYRAQLDLSSGEQRGETPLIGPNRAGKTTLLLTISGILETSEGRVF